MFFAYSRLQAWLIGLCVLSILCCPTARATEESLEYSVKGAYVFKFSAFVEWPPTAFATSTSPLIIGIVGDDPFGNVLDQTIKDRTVNNRPIQIRRFKHGEQPQDVHILFISQSERKQLDSIVSNLHGVLTIGEFDSTTSGTMINFMSEDNKVRFEVDLDQANRAGVKLSSKLLSVARSVKGKIQ